MLCDYLYDCLFRTRSTSVTLLSVDLLALHGVSDIPPGHFPSRTFPQPNPNHKPNPSSNPNSSPNPADPILILTLLTPLLTLTLTEQGRGKMSEGNCPGGLSVSLTLC